MSFATIEYLFFLLIVFILYWGVPHKIRWIVLLTTSCYFYMQWNAKYIVLITFTVIVSYSAGVLLEKIKCIKVKKIIMAVSISLCLLVLFTFKYFNFFMDSIKQTGIIFGVSFPEHYLAFALPVGISFYTFQTISYVIDIYRQNIHAERHFGMYATYVFFFPQLVAGPIERSRNLLPQLKRGGVFEYEKAVRGLEQMLLGYLKKIVIADTLAVYVDKVWSNMVGYSGFTYIIIAIMFSVQIYCDFSGYSDIAVGTAKLFGIELMTNFRSPYFSQSLHEFWTKWHISLSTWLRDYIYIPLGGNRKGRYRKELNLIITFLISGLWHGASWTYVFWGGMHGIGQVVENACLKKTNIFSNNRIICLVKTGLVFAFVTFGWIFFRAPNMSEAFYFIMGIGNGMQDGVLGYIVNGIRALGGSKNDLVKIATGCIFLFVADIITMKKDVFGFIRKLPKVTRWILYYTISILIIYSWLGQSSDTSFIYFQF